MGVEGVEEEVSTPSAEFVEVCEEVGAEKELMEEGWRSYDSVSQQCTLEGSQRAWYTCALYLANCPAVFTNNSPAVYHKISLSSLVDISGLTVLEFFEKLSKWTEMATNSRRVQDHVGRVQSGFAVSAVIFKKFLPIFRRVFAGSGDDGSKRGTKRQKKPNINPLTPALLEFCWLLYITSKKHFSGIGDDLMNCFHLLLCSIDFVRSNLDAHGHKEYLQTEFAEGNVEGDEEGSILDTLCSKFDGVVLDAKHFRVHWWLPKMKNLIDDGLIIGDANESLLDKLGENTKRLHNSYEEAVLRRNEMDERIFLPEDRTLLLTEDALEDPMIALKRKPETSKKQNLDTDLLLRMSVQSCLERISHYRLPTPLSGRSYVISGEQFCPVTPVSAVTQSLSKLHSLLQDCPSGLSSDMERLFSPRKDNPSFAISEILKDMGDSFEKLCRNDPNFDEGFTEFSHQRREQAESLYYRFLERIVGAEKDRAQPSSFTSALCQDIFHRSLFAAALELVIFTYNSERVFSWVLKAFDIPAIHFYKVIELIIRAEPELSREMVKHLNMIEERVLEELAWVVNSPLWAQLDQSPGVPTCQEVALPSQIDKTTGMPNVLSGVKSGGVGQSPFGVGGRFQSPTKATGPAKRKLSFDDGSGTGDPSKYQAVESRSGNTPLKQGSGGGGSGSEESIRSSSLSLFFRKVYYLASVRLLDLADRLRLNEKAKQGVWTMLERVVVDETDLMRGRHLDQILMSCVYVISKVSKLDVSFHDIMCQYRYQPQATSAVYRNVLMGWGEGSSEKQLRSSSTLPVPGVSSAPPTPEPKDEEYGDLIKFYNRMFVGRVEGFAKKLCPSGDGPSKENLSVPLSPLPSVKSHALSPRRRVADGVYVSPMQIPGQPVSPSRPMRYSFSRSPYKDLKAINSMIKHGADQGKTSLYSISSAGFKRSLGSASESASGPSRMLPYK